MRVVFIILCALMLLFMGVQYNDPDGLLWMAIYGVPALWCALAVVAKSMLAKAFVKGVLLVCVLSSLIGVIVFWPEIPQFWTRDVWYNVEAARESMGLMIIAVVLGIVYFYSAKQHTDSLL